MPKFSDFDLTVRNVADQLGVSYNTVVRWSDKGDLAHIKTPGGWRKYRQYDVDAFIDRHIAGDAA